MNKKIDKFDYILIIIIVGLYAILSFINLGSFKNPNTFLNLNYNEELLIEFDKEIFIDEMVLFAGNMGANYQLVLDNDIIDVSTKAFSWKKTYIGERVNSLRLIANNKASIGEIAFYNDDIKINIKQVIYEGKPINTLNDEEDTIPKQINYMNSTYFDEIYFARTAYEYANGLMAYEWVHPPLGKLIQAIPIAVFHRMAPFYYRLMGNIAGILMVLVMYLFAKKLFNKRNLAVVASLLMAFDTFHFAQTRMGTVDSFLVLFIILAFYFMYNYIIGENENRNLFLSGLFFGCSVTTKWIGLYGGLALAIIFLTHVIKNKKVNFKLFLKSVCFFVLVPLLIYIGSYYIYPNVAWFNDFSIGEVFNQSLRMYDYHHNLKATHPYSSPFYTWPFSYKPVWYYSSYNEANLHGSISGVGNIIIWWFGILSYIYIFIKLFKKKDKIAYFLLCAITFTFLPFVFIGRLMFLYHYFAILPFIMLAVVYTLKDIAKKFKSNFVIYFYLLLVILFFIIYYPEVSGVYMPQKYFEFIEIFRTWVF